LEVGRSIADASSMRLQDVLKPAGYWFQSLHRVEVAKNAAPLSSDRLTEKGKSSHKR
jgi:hypothetical protein